MPAGGGCLTRPAWGCLGYQIFILVVVFYGLAAPSANRRANLALGVRQGLPCTPFSCSVLCWSLGDTPLRPLALAQIASRNTFHVSRILIIYEEAEKFICS
jgi:hypothetical protein